MSLDSFEIRAGTREHIGELLSLSRFLDSVNLPADRDSITRLLDTSERSFSRDIADPRRREYVFVLWDRAADRAAGTSSVIGQLGRRDAPYIYFDVRAEEKYSATLDRHFTHTVLRTCYAYDGPTEIGGLVVHPEYRRRPEHLGRLVSYVRFLWLAMRRADFRDEVVAALRDSTTELRIVSPSGTRSSSRGCFRGLCRPRSSAPRRSRSSVPSVMRVAGSKRCCGGSGSGMRSVSTHSTEVRTSSPQLMGSHWFALPAAARCGSRLARARRIGAGFPRGRGSRRPPFFRAVVAGLSDADSVPLSPILAAAMGISEGDSVWSTPLAT